MLQSLGILAFSRFSKHCMATTTLIILIVTIQCSINRWHAKIPHLCNTRYGKNSYYRLSVYTSLPPFLPFVLSSSLFFHFLTARVSPLKNVTTTIISYAISHSHEGTWKLQKTCADTVGLWIDSISSLHVWKLTSHSAFRCASHELAVAHSSTDPAQNCLT